MPYPNEHAARLHDPGKYDSFLRQHPPGWPMGLDIVWGLIGNDREIQALRFDRRQWTEQRARDWLKRHGYEPVLFEVATGPE